MASSALQVKSLGGCSALRRPVASSPPVSFGCTRTHAASRAIRSRQAAVQVRAQFSNRPDPVQQVSTAVNSFFQRYDVASTGMGALAVTSYCVYVRGQDPFTALSITFTSTVVALVINEMMFNKASK